MLWRQKEGKFGNKENNESCYLGVRRLMKVVAWGHEEVS